MYKPYDARYLVEKELEAMYAKHGRLPWGRHEFLGVLMEEFEEIKQDIYDNAPSDQLVKEIAQVAGVCLRYLETGNRYNSGTL